MRPFNPTHAFDFLLGEWSFEREIPQQASIRGKALVSIQQDGTALYAEAALVTLTSGERLHGERRYLYRKMNDGFSVFFHDTAALFHDLRFAPDGDGCLRAHATHACKADFYRSTYELWDHGSMHVQHIVQGPRKDFQIDTVYRRADLGVGIAQTGIASDLQIGSKS
jgi:hypothetical protein